MSEDIQDVTVETPAEETATEGVNAEPQETKAEETDVESPKADSEESAPEETVEAKAERLERDSAGKQKAIDRKTAAYHSLQKKYDEQRQESERLTQLIEQQTPETEPNIDDFETHDEYVNALVEFRSKKEVEKQQSALANQQKQLHEEKIMASRLSIRQTQEAEYITENPMYKTAASEVETYINTMSGVSAGAQEAIIEQVYAGNVPEVINYFGSNNGENLDELGTISKLSPPQAAVEIYKIQQKLSSSPKSKKQSPRVVPVKTEKGNTNSSKPLAKSSGEDILKWVNS